MATEKGVYTKDLYFLIFIGVLCSIFLCLQYFYIHTLPLVMDEFHSAYHSVRIFRMMPYADYIPYKNLLGHLLHGLLLNLTNDHWAGLILVKTYLVLLNTFMLALVALLLRKHLQPKPIIISLALLIVMSTFLERSAELRVDMESAWLGCLSFLLLLRKRWGWAGILAGISFLFTQKGAYYIVAGELAVLYLWYKAPSNRNMFKSIIRFNVCIVLMVVCYGIIWSLISGSPVGVIKGILFLHGKQVVFGNVYGNMRYQFWTQTIWRNPLFYFLAVTALWRLDCYRRQNPEDHMIQMVVIYVCSMVILCFLHTKPWPYFMVMLFPSLFILVAFYLDRESGHFSETRAPSCLTPGILVVFIFFGFFWPLQRVAVVAKRDLLPQMVTVKIAEKILGKGETYFGGLPYLYRHDQVDPDLERLTAPQILSLRRADKKTLQGYINIMRNAKMKFIIQSYRTKRLPELMKHYLSDNFTHLWANVFIYSPTISLNSNGFNLKFTGRYFVQGVKGAVNIDGTNYSSGSLFELKAGLHKVDHANSNGSFRLTLFPKGVENHLITEYRNPVPLFPNSYSY